MAMTKKERAEFEALQKELRLAKALRWPDTPTPARLPLPERGFLNGWDFGTYGKGEVWEAWTETSAHGKGHRAADDGYRSGSQRERPVYATKMDALIALRGAMTREVAEILARIDAQIEAERASPE